MLAAACLLLTMGLQKLKGSSRARGGEEQAAKQQLMRHLLSAPHTSVYNVHTLESRPRAQGY